MSIKRLVERLYRLRLMVFKGVQQRFFGTETFKVSYNTKLLEIHDYRFN